MVDVEVTVCGFLLCFVVYTDRPAHFAKEEQLLMCSSVCIRAPGARPRQGVFWLCVGSGNTSTANGTKPTIE